MYTDRQTDRQTNRQTDRQTDIHTYSPRYAYWFRTLIGMLMTERRPVIVECGSAGGVATMTSFRQVSAKITIIGIKNDILAKAA